MTRLNPTTLIACFAGLLLCAACCRAEEEKKELILPADITTSKVNFQKLNKNNAVQKSNTAPAQEHSTFKNTSGKTKTTYIFLNKETDKPVPQRWKTPSKNNAEPGTATRSAAAPKTKTVVKKLKVTQTKYGDTSFINKGNKSDKKTGIPADLMKKMMGGGN
ncbi:MAG TPA: hypothetical protein PLL10_00870 [Elusimicrobiales bacterium]|nr:hypothetical protein [Elusimicrobiales bacterium]